MSNQVTINYGGKSQVVARAVAESQVVKAEAAIANLRAQVAERHAAHRAKPTTSDAEQAAADKSAAEQIARYEAIVAACRAALEA